MPTSRGMANAFKLRDIVNIKEPTFGAKGDASTNDAAALQAAHDALGPDGGAIFIPPVSANFRINTQVDFTKCVTLEGGGIQASELVTTTSGLVMITTTNKLVVKDLGFTASGAAVGTATGVKTLAAASNHTETVLRDCLFQSFAKCYHSERSAALHISHCRFAPSAGNGLYLENQTNSDEGDSFVHDNYFAGGAGDTSIKVVSTSGLNLTANKFNGAVDVHVDVAPTSNDVGNFLFANNSFEGHITAAVRLIGTTGVIVKTLITGNQFSSDVVAHVVVGNNAKHTVITGNSFNDTDPADGIGVDIQAGANTVTITGNLFYQILTAIKSTGNIVGEHISGNKYKVSSSGSENVTNIYLGGEDDQNLNGPGSEKDFEIDRFIVNTSNSAYVNAFSVRGNCIVEVFVTGIVQGAAGNCGKYRKCLLHSGPTVTDIVAEIAFGAATFDLQVAASGSDVVIGVKRNGATGTSVTMQVRVKITGYPREIKKV